MISLRKYKVRVAFVLFIALCTAAYLTSQRMNRAETMKQNQEMQILTIGTADSGGTMYPAGRAIAQILNEAEPALKINISASGGSLSNVKALRDGQIDLALISADVAYSAYNGTEQFKNDAMENLRVVGAIYLSCSNWMASADSNIIYVHDLLGKRVAIGPQDSTTELSSRMALKAVGIDESNTQLENYGLGSGSVALKDGTVDAVHGFAGIPITSMAELAQGQPCRLLQYTEEELNYILASNNQFVRAVIPAGTYAGQTGDIETFGVKCLLCVSESMDEELVYTIAKNLYQSIDVLTYQQSEAGFISGNLPVPLHPGAVRYYKEAGLMP